MHDIMISYLLIRRVDQQLFRYLLFQMKIFVGK